MFSVTLVKHLNELKKDDRYVLFIKKYISTFLNGELLTNLDENFSRSDDVFEIQRALNALLASIYLFKDSSDGLAVEKLGVNKDFLEIARKRYRALENDALLKLKNRLSIENIIESYYTLSDLTDRPVACVDLKTMFLDRALYRAYNVFDIEDISELSPQDLTNLVRWNFLAFKFVCELLDI